MFVTALDSYTIQTFTRYAVQFKTVDPIPNNSKIKVRFPTTITLVAGPCSLTSASPPLSLTASCVVTENVIILTNPFIGTQSYDPTVTGASLSFIFNSGGTNPMTACDAGSFHIYTYAIFGGIDYAIDYYMFNAKDDIMPRFSAFFPLQAALTARMLPPSSYVTYHVPTTYTIQITPTLKFPRLSVMTLVFPPTVALMQGLSSISCTAYLPSATVITSSPITSYNPVTFTITSLFTYQGYTQTGTSFNLACEGLQNPKTLEPTSSFSISVFDSNGCGI